MRTFVWCTRPTVLLGNMIQRVIKEGSFEESFTFSSLKNMIVVAAGLDKSYSDFIGTWRVCNRKRGNLSLYVQLFACLEGPVAECYENEI